MTRTEPSATGASRGGRGRRPRGPARRHGGGCGLGPVGPPCWAAALRRTALGAGARPAPGDRGQPRAGGLSLATACKTPRSVRRCEAKVVLGNGGAWARPPPYPSWVCVAFQGNGVLLVRKVGWPFGRAPAVTDTARGARTLWPVTAAVPRRSRKKRCCVFSQKSLLRSVEEITSFRGTDSFRPVHSRLSAFVFTAFSLLSAKLSTCCETFGWFFLVAFFPPYLLHNSHTNHPARLAFQPPDPGALPWDGPYMSAELFQLSPCPYPAEDVCVRERHPDTAPAAWQSPAPSVKTAAISAKFKSVGRRCRIRK